MPNRVSTDIERTNWKKQPVDVKEQLRADIRKAFNAPGNTRTMYSFASAIAEKWGCNANTVNSYLRVRNAATKKDTSYAVCSLPMREQVQQEIAEKKQLIVDAEVLLSVRKSELATLISDIRAAISLETEALVEASIA